MAPGDSLVSAAIGPNGVAAPGQPYYLALDLSVPHPPQSGDAEHFDCAFAARPTDAREPFARILTGALGEVTSDWPTPSAITPGCVASPSAACAPTVVCVAVPAYASYGIETGRYHVEAPPVLLGGVAQTSFSGSTGAGVRDDCENCPPPVCC